MTDTLEMLVSIEQRLARLEDIEAIKRVISRYTDGADMQNDPAIMAPLFHEDGVWEAEGFGSHKGAMVIAAALADIARTQITWSIHYMVLPTIDVEPDGVHARCQWYLWELAKVKGGDGVVRDSWFAAKYDSALTKDTVGWRFTRLLLKPMLNCPVGEPWPAPAEAQA